MTILSFPTAPNFRDFDFGIVFRTQIFSSPLSPFIQTLELDASNWIMSGKLPPMLRAAAVEWQTFGIKLRGTAGRFYGYDVDAEKLGNPRNTIAGTILIDGANQTGVNLNLKGASVGDRFVKGDYMAWDAGAGNARELHMVVDNQDAATDTTVTVLIEPPIRQSPADSQAVIFSKASCVMRLIDDNQAKWSTNHLIHYGFQLNAVEAYRET